MRGQEYLETVSVGKDRKRNEGNGGREEVRENRRRQRKLTAGSKRKLKAGSKSRRQR